jgi:hypothetical protein
LTLLERELQRVIPESAHLIEGSSDEVAFFALTYPMDVEEGEEARLLLIHYRLKSDPDGPGSILVREEAIVEGPLPTHPQNGDDLDASVIKLGRTQRFELASAVEEFRIRYLWLPTDAETDSAGALAPEIVTLHENPRGRGLPQAITISLVLADPISEDGRMAFTTSVVFPGPTTRLTREKIQQRFGDWGGSPA